MTVTLGNDELLGIAHDLGMLFYPVNFCVDRIDLRWANASCQRIIDVRAEKAKTCATRFAPSFTRVAFLFLRHNVQKYCRVRKDIL